MKNWEDEALTANCNNGPVRELQLLPYRELVIDSDAYHKSGRDEDSPGRD